MSNINSESDEQEKTERIKVTFFNFDGEESLPENAKDLLFSESFIKESNRRISKLKEINELLSNKDTAVEYITEFLKKHPPPPSS